MTPPEAEKEHGRGHIGLVVLGSIAGGLILGLVLVLGVFAGGPESVITADIGQLSGWPAAQKRLAGLSTNSIHETAHGATRAALLEDRDYAAVSSRAIDALVRSVRTGNPVTR
jgi:hypothetical protein